ncbi:MAG: SGNH/GDSL hydrolase family protein [Thermoguttaceae bacterium]|jgi:lysophospholipase L1-like esterase
MRKSLLPVLAVSVLLVGARLIAEEAVQKEIVFDGDKQGENAKGWVAAGSGKVTVAAQDKEVRTPGRKTVEFHAAGKEWMGCGWNWFGWWPEDAGTDITAYKNLTFWAKLSATKKPGMLTATLVSPGKKSSQAGNLLTYCPNLPDGKWHQLSIPIKELDSKNELDRTKVWEIMLGTWSQDEEDFSLFVDEIAFEGQAEKQVALPPLALPNEVAARDKNIRYIGRWDMANPAAPRASWTYSLVTAKFSGTALGAKLKGGGYYQITVDGQPTAVLAPKPGRDTYEVARGLSQGEHTVEIIRRNEGPWIAPLTFLGFQLEKDSKLLPLPPRSQRRILIIGDSISCGYGNEATRDEGNPPDKQNGYMTYGAIAARKLGAEVQIVAWSGRKLYPDNTMVEVYDRTLAMDANPKADLSGWVPGVVVIDLGTNDFGNNKNPPQEKGWIDAYKAFIGTIRQTAPAAYVFVASGPMGTAANWDKWAKTVVADLREAGDKRIAYLPFATQDINGDGIGGHWHPNLKTHAKMAERLKSEIEKAVGWR